MKSGNRSGPAGFRAGWTSGTAGYKKKAPLVAGLSRPDNRTDYLSALNRPLRNKKPAITPPTIGAIM